MVPISWFLQILTPFSADRIQSERHRIISEGGDLLGFVMFLALAAGVAVLLLSHLRTLVPRPVVLQHHPYIIPVLSSTLLLFHLGSLHKWRVNSFGDVFLDGFGLPRTALVMLCLFLFLRERHLGNLGAWFDHNVTRIIACVVIATSLTPFVFPIWRGVDNVRHLEISLNELAAPAAGMGIFEDFFPVYSNLLGIVAGAIANCFRSPLAKLYSLWVFYVTVNALVLLLTVILARRINRSRFLILTLVFVTVISAQQLTVGARTVLSDQSLGSRFLFPVLTLILVTYVLERSDCRLLGYLILGIFLGLTLVNNSEFGIGVVIPVIGVLGIRGLAQRHHLMGLITTLISTAITALVLLWLISGGQIGSALSSLRLFTSARLVGGYITPTPIWGVHQFALATYVVGALLGVKTFWHATTNSQIRVLSNSGILMISALWGILSYPKYLGDNGVAFWSQVIIPLGLTLLGLINHYFFQFEAATWPVYGSASNNSETHRILFLKSLTTFLFLCLTALPDPQLSIGRYFDVSRENWTPRHFMEEPLVAAVRDEVKRANASGEIGYYGEYANLISLSTGAIPVYGVSDPMIAYSTAGTVAATCKPLQSQRVSVVLASKEYLPSQFLRADAVGGPCKGMTRDPSFNSDLIIRYLFDLTA